MNIYRQNGTYAMVLRRLPFEHTLVGIPAAAAGVPGDRQRKERPHLCHRRFGQRQDHHAGGAAERDQPPVQGPRRFTLEDPIEFLHPQLKSTFSQRELGRDFYNFPDGLRAALRQAPKVIFVGEIRDRETMEIALTAGETGHVVYSTLHTISAGQTIHRILGLFSQG